MTVRVNAHHIICPGCLEKVFVDELVGGHCPLCGCVMEEEDDVQEFEEVIERSDLAWIVFHYFVFRKFDALGVSPIQIMQLISQLEEAGCTDPNPQKMDFHLEIPMGRLEKILPKRCTHCNVLFIRGGRKIISGNLNQQGYVVGYRCPGC
ncbi:MAG: hypothetical protein LUP99_06015 [Methanomicrobiales archaeon]|nr:hypothetical protein [Methanomicrobiales archaeon]